MINNRWRTTDRFHCINWTIEKVFLEWSNWVSLSSSIFRSKYIVGIFHNQIYYSNKGTTIKSSSWIMSSSTDGESLSLQQRQILDTIDDLISTLPRERHLHAWPLQYWCCLGHQSRVWWHHMASSSYFCHHEAPSSLPVTFPATLCSQLLHMTLFPSWKVTCRNMNPFLVLKHSPPASHRCYSLSLFSVAKLHDLLLAAVLCVFVVTQMMMLFPLGTSSTNYR